MGGQGDGSGLAEDGWPSRLIDLEPWEKSRWAVIDPYRYMTQVHTERAAEARAVVDAVLAERLAEQRAERAAARRARVRWSWQWVRGVPGLAGWVAWWAWRSLSMLRAPFVRRSDDHD
jgi:hypothetical protein